MVAHYRTINQAVGFDGRASTNIGVANDAVRANGDALFDGDIAFQYHVHIDNDVTGDLYAATDIQPGGITEGDPITHQRFSLCPLKNTLETG